MVSSHAMKKPFRIGLLIERNREYGRALAEGVAAYARERQDWSLSFLNGRTLSRRTNLTAFDGFIARVIDDRTAEILSAAKRPVVDVFYERRHSGFAVVESNHHAVGARAAEHFLKRRFTSFAFCGDASGYAKALANGFARRLARDGFVCRRYSPVESLRYAFNAKSVIDDEVGPPPDAIRLRSWLVKLPKPIAVFCAQDLRAMHVLRICQDVGIDVPRNIAILGVDDDRLICEFSTPMLSSIDPNARKIGRTAAQTLAGMIERPHAWRTHPPVAIVEPNDVVLRASTAVYPVEPDWLSDALVYIHAHATEGITAADVFTALNRSHTLVNRAFKNQLGTHVQREIARARLEAARSLLKKTTLPIKEIAARSGFQSDVYFNRAFTAAHGGTPPGAWRRLQ